MKSSVTEVAPGTYRISTFHPDFGLQFNQFLVDDDEPFLMMAKDMPYTSDTDPTLRRLAALRPRTIALMHGSTFCGDGERALLDLATVIRETLGTP